MKNNDAATGLAPGAEEVFDGGNVSEIFPGASMNKPVLNPPNPAWPAETEQPALGLAGAKRARKWAKDGMEAGMATAEYAIATLAAVGFAGLLVVILKSDEVRGFLLNVIRTALSF
ncbi:DUF4244 domain-containing protein [Arthrobacter sp. LAPM80]|uniref:DUF4244 domain-containing protein n=1 Tax=Arthrobacter sp. LAPM80 TaxID=3141788 RepID=UPI00398A8211